MAGLFKNKIIKENLKKFQIENIESKLDIVRSWQKSYKDGELQKKNETQSEQSFNQDFFSGILEYAQFPNDTYHIKPKDNVETGGGQMPDATLGYFSKDYKRVIAVVEIKDSNTPLDKPQRREGSLTPIQQAFKYKPQYKDCGFVIATNFYEFRLYRDDQLDYESFNLDDLIDPKDDYFNFKKFYYLLCVKNFISEKGQTETEKLLSAIRIKQEDITKNFYKRYKDLRQALIKDISTNNKILLKDFYTKDVEKAQKIIDRIVFICFFEDSGLLPENKLIEVIEYAQKGDLPEPIWDTIKKFFKAIDEGSPRLGIPTGYNGELFKYDEDLDKLKISDDICKSFVDLSKYDFKEDLSENILGHIFEQSISDLEKLRSYGEGEVIENKKEKKRKEDGIFYTPEYIVDYIIKNSLGKYLEEKESLILSEYDLDNDTVQDKTYNKKIVKAYEEYRKFLTSVKVLDPACGSGAFLVKVFDYLLAEHNRVFKIVNEAQNIKGSTVNSLFNDDDFIKPILENNIFGVDLNAESVEITKLSLWLKSAKKGKKLTTLKNNIKCGNSLIDDPNIAGPKAFNWKKEFESIFATGGFDVIVGNPPYIKEYTNKQAFDGLHTNPYYEGKMDLWQFFTCLGIDLLKKDGRISYIAPSSWITNSGAKKMRNKVLKDSTIEKFIDFGDYNVFAQAGIQTMIFVLKKEDSKLSNIEYLKLNKTDDVANSLYKTKEISFDQSNFIDKTISFISNKSDSALLDKIASKSSFKLTDKEVANGIHSHYDFVNNSIYEKHRDILNIDQGIFGLSNKEKNALVISEKENEIIKPYFTTSEISRYYADNKNKLWIIYTDSKFKDIKEIEAYPNIKKHLDKFKDVITSDNKPYGLHRARDEKFFIGEKIVAVRKCPERPVFSYVDFDSYVSATFYVIKSDRVNLKFLTGILNSTLTAFWLRNKGKMQGNNYQLDKEPLINIPICISDKVTQETVADKVDTLIEKNTEFTEKAKKNLELIKHEFGIEKINKKLDKFYTLSFDEFIKESKINFSIEKKSELLDYFNKQKDTLNRIKNEIATTDKEIDQIVYRIYDLSPKEIDIIESGK
jgi:type I restriction-modification system DNA methylase subunit